MTAAWRRSWGMLYSSQQAPSLKSLRYSIRTVLYETSVMAPQFEMGTPLEMRNNASSDNHSAIIEDFIPWRALGAVIVLGGFILFITILGLSIYVIFKYLNQERSRIEGASAAALDLALLARSQRTRRGHHEARSEDVEMQDIHRVCCHSCTTDLVSTDSKLVKQRGARVRHCNTYDGSLSRGLAVSGKMLERSNLVHSFEDESPWHVNWTRR